MMYALIAVSRKGKECIILDCSADEDDLESWAREFDSIGSFSPFDLGMIVPEKNGIFVWQGKVVYTPEHAWGTDKDPGPEWCGIWRMATYGEVRKFMRGHHIWKIEIGLRNKIKSE